MLIDNKGVADAVAGGRAGGRGGRAAAGAGARERGYAQVFEVGI